jgi:hypothetical protein
MQTFTNDGVAAHAEGNGSSALGEASHAEGEKTYAYGECSHVQGYCTSALSDNSCAAGSHTIAASADMTVIGHYNLTSAGALFVIGNGSGNNTRSDALVINDTQMIQQTNTSPIVYSNIYSAGEINISYSTPGGGSVTNLKPSRVYLGVPQHSLTINAADGISFAVVGGTSIYLNNYGITAVPVQGSSASIDWVTLINKVNAL